MFNRITTRSVFESAEQLLANYQLTTLELVRQSLVNRDPEAISSQSELKQLFTVISVVANSVGLCSSKKSVSRFVELLSRRSGNITR